MYREVFGGANSLGIACVFAWLLAGMTGPEFDEKHTNMRTHTHHNRDQYHRCGSDAIYVFRSLNDR